mmetsp:Transcript_75/g.66  ORF Transcript_75/g.66 Transcript_75/m.66 type:complete len:98 (+) Transcript_75:10-303(+)
MADVQKKEKDTVESGDTKCNSVFDLYKKNNETEKMYRFREKVYNRVVEDTNSKEKAKVISNIIVNKLSIGCEYPKEVIELAEKYLEEIKDKDNIWKV